MRTTAIAVLGVMLVALGVRGEEWPQWRGPRGDGISRETGLLEKWPEGGLKKMWSKDVGIGYSSPVAVDGKVYLLSLVDKNETLTAFDAESGNMNWSQSYEGGWHGNYPGSRAAPTIEGDRIYTYGGGGELVCRELADGKLVWRINVLEETKAANLIWAVASAPLIVGDLVFVQNGRGKGVPVAVGVDKKTGKIVWRTEASGKAKEGTREAQGGGYAHMILADVSGTKQLIVFASDTLYGVALETGKTIWSVPWETKYDVNAATPVYRDGLLFITSDYGSGCMMLKLRPDGADKLWQSKAVESRFQGAILDGDLLFSNSEGTIKCLVWPSGELKWECKNAALRLNFGGSIVRVGDKLITMSERGKLSLAKATAEGIELISQQQLLDGREIWATPLIYRGKLYCKGTAELVCVDLTGR